MDSTARSTPSEFLIFRSDRGCLSLDHADHSAHHSHDESQCAYCDENDVAQFAVHEDEPRDEERGQELPNIEACGVSPMRISIDAI